MEDLLRLLLSAPPDVEPQSSLAAWWEAHRAAKDRWAASFDRAVAGGFASDRVGYAFAAGYRSALEALVPSLGEDRLAALCATEEGGAHPRAIRTSLDLAPTPRAGDGRAILSGKKRWATLAASADELLIVASIGIDASGKNRLRVARVRADQPGVRVVLMPPTPFVPEIPHAEVELSGVVIEADDLLPGDGYEAYLKPFRTIEDLHVHGALLGYLIGAARRWGLGRALVERASAVVVCARSLASVSPSAPEVHVALAGTLAHARLIAEEMTETWSRASDAAAVSERERWARDRPILDVAGKARGRRLEKAWDVLAHSKLSGVLP